MAYYNVLMLYSSLLQNLYGDTHEFFKPGAQASYLGKIADAISIWKGKYIIIVMYRVSQNNWRSKSPIIC